MASAAALTLADHAAQSQDPMQKKLTKSVLSDVSILDDLPLVTNASLYAKGARFTDDDLPGQAWGKINQAPKDSKTTTQRYEEQVSLIRRRVQVDRKLLNDPNWIDDPFDTQFQGSMAADVQDMNWAFFNNDPAQAGTGNHSEDAWIGVRTRLRDAVKYKIATGLRIDCGGLNFKGTMTAANALDFFEFLAKAFAYLGASDGRGCVGYTNWLGKARWERAIKIQNTAGGFAITKDSFDREIERYRQCKVSDIGFYRGDVTKPIIPNTQDATGVDTGAGNCTSIVIVRYGDLYMKGWQTNAMKPEYLGRSTEYGTYDNAIVDWGCGLCHAHNRPFVELYNLQIS